MRCRTQPQPGNKVVSSSHLLISHPASRGWSLGTTSIRQLGEVRPVMRNNSGRKANIGLFPFFLTSLPFRISCRQPLGSILLCWRYCWSWHRTLPSALAKLKSFLLLLQTEQQVFLPVALQIPRDLSSLAFTRGIPQRSPAYGSRSPARMALRMACPVTPLTSLNTLPNWISSASAPSVSAGLRDGCRMRSCALPQYVALCGFLRRPNEFRSRPYVCSFISHWLSARRSSARQILRIRALTSILQACRSRMSYTRSSTRLGLHRHVPNPTLLQPFG